MGPSIIKISIFLFFACSLQTKNVIQGEDVLVTFVAMSQEIFAYKDIVMALAIARAILYVKQE